MAKLTDRQLKNLKPKAKRYDLRDGHGLGVRVTTTGKITFWFVYETTGKRYRVTLGLYPALSLAEARHQAEALRVQIRAGENPMEERRRKKQEEEAAVTIEQLANRYIADHARVNMRPKSAREVERLLLKEVVPKLGTLRADHVTRIDLSRLVKNISKRAPIVANRVLSWVRSMYLWAIREGLLNDSPATLIPFPAKGNARDRVLNSNELKTLWQALDAGEGRARLNPVTVAAARFIIASGQRKNEVLRMRWDELDNPDSPVLWKIPVSHAKNKLEHRVFVSASMREILAGLDRKCAYVFPSPIRHNLPMHETSLNSIFPRLKSRGFLESVSPFTIHDFRRTAATVLGESGFVDDEIGLFLNHTRQGVTARYNRSTYDSKRKLLMQTWDRCLSHVLLGKGWGNAPADNVIPIHGKR